MNTRRLVLMSLFIALSAVGGFVKIPSPTGTIAFDSLPGYLGAVILPGWQGAVIGALGHLFSAWTVSFPLGFALHTYIGLQMAFYVSIFGLLFKKGHKLFAIVTAIILNGVIAPALLIPIIGTGIFWTLLLPLIVGSAANIIIAAILANSSIIKKVGEEIDVEEAGKLSGLNNN